MKKQTMNILYVIFLMLSLSAYSGKVYVSIDQNGAKKVYVTTNRNLAHMFVCFVSDANQSNKSYLWYKVKDRNSADLIIYYVQDKNQADLIIYVVQDKNSACIVQKKK